MKKRITLILVMALLVTAVLGGNTAFAAKKPILSAKKLSLKVGQTRTVSIKNAKKVKWKVVSGKACVSISKKKKSVRIKGRKAGKAKLRAKSGKTTLYCTITVTKKKSGSGTDPKPQPGEDDPLFTEKDVDMTQSVSISSFSLDMLSHLRKDSNKGKNSLISPDSIVTALAMAANGAAGDTGDQMNRTMHIKSAEALSRYLYVMHRRLTGSKDVTYRVADSVWTNQGLIEVRDKFIQDNQTYFQAQVYNVPFDKAAIDNMNAWVRKNTDDMIPSIIDNLPPEARMVLLNAICFKGNWAEPYDNRQVSDELFTTASGKEKQVPTLHGYDSGNLYMELAGGRGFLKHYTDGQFAFFAFLPPEGQSPDEWLKKVDGDAFAAACTDCKNRQIITRIPEFKLDYSTSLADTLKALGMEDAFDSTKADFSGISQQPLVIDDVLHKTHIELDKDGTRAAAATAIVAKNTAAPTEEEPETIILNRPFLYGIMDTYTGTPLFVGVLDDPVQEAE